MNHLKILGIKFIAISVLVLSIFGMTNATTIPNLLLISLIMTVTTYVIGDVLILRTAGNLTATLSDFALLFVGLWLLGNYSIGTDQPIMALSLTAAFFISFVEPFIHRMILEQTEEKTTATTPAWTGQLQTEFSEELDPGEQEPSDDNN
ncbi:uncharacterized protein JNUCC1_02151 [Lentibacillus sp. JNUCC-1]|uniref:DUF2512 family protein n=1 Tax=Lentibacillus sp. JNUCC-1 TaxID=2654513 RepID=UPI0012E878A3|nr:DUF2512 family protein [Lentibacillus sp. JNUCC-1]MUV38313.1 uncharacterized protein [Lentibacillus sp. JNUCC-1]